jgi:hypothetical protein
LPQALVGAFTVDSRFVFPGQGRRCEDLNTLGLGQRPDPRSRRQDEPALDRSRPTLLIKEGHQRLTDPQLGDGDCGIKCWIGP